MQISDYQIGVEVETDKQLSEINWIAQLQMTELPITFEDEDGYDKALENKALFDLAHDEEMGRRKAILDKMTNLFMEGEKEECKRATKAAKKAKRKAYQEQLVQKHKEEQEAREQARIRAQQTNTPQGKMALEFSKARQAVLAKMHRALNYRQDHVKRQALAEYHRLTEVCMMTKAAAVQQILNRYC
jgi:hypothetical protein